MTISKGVPAGFLPFGPDLYVDRPGIEQFLKNWAETPQRDSILVMNAPPGFGKTWIIEHWYREFQESSRRNAETRSSKIPAPKPRYLIARIPQAADFFTKENDILYFNQVHAVAWAEKLVEDACAFYSDLVAPLTTRSTGFQILGQLADALINHLPAQPGLALLVLIDGIDELGSISKGQDRQSGFIPPQEEFSREIILPLVRTGRGNPAARDKIRVIITGRETPPQLDSTSKKMLVTWTNVTLPAGARKFTPPPLDPWDQFCCMARALPDYRDWAAVIQKPAFRASFEDWKRALKYYEWDIPLVNAVFFDIGFSVGDTDPDPAYCNQLKPLTARDIRVAIKQQLERPVVRGKPHYPILTDDLFNILLQVAQLDHVDAESLAAILPLQGTENAIKHPFRINADIWGILQSNNLENGLTKSVHALLRDFLRLSAHP